MAAVDAVIVAQLAADGGRDALAADAQMDQSVDLEVPFQRADALLEEADPPDRPQRGARRIRLHEG
jgi:hypothetical protein